MYLKYSYYLHVQINTIIRTIFECIYINSIFTLNLVTYCNYAVYFTHVSQMF